MASKEGSRAGDGGENKEEFLPGYESVLVYSSKVLRSMLLAIRDSNNLPNEGDDFDYYSSFTGFRDVMDAEAKSLLEVLQNMMQYHGVRKNILRNQDVTELEDKFDILVDANDQLLERVGAFLDEAAGLKKQESPLVVATATPCNKTISGTWNKKKQQTNVFSRYKLLSAKYIQRPQLKFKDKIDNSPRPFIPKIKRKPNALRPLSESLVHAQGSEVKNILDEENLENLTLPHPYQYELDHFSPPDFVAQRSTPQEPLPLDTTPLTYVDSEESLQDLLVKLQGQREVAVDLEHHSYRSFQGFTCLMQISTRSEDFIIDTLALRSELHKLNDVFTNPNIVKVLHGADLDIEWMQRDFGLYIVNLFDTGQAARVLSLSRFSLAYLLLSYCGVEANKQFQLADWRIRPLPEELLRYAREDTHYLLYIYDRLRNELLERGNAQKNLLYSVLQRSTQLCAKKYMKPDFTSDKYMVLYQHSRKAFNRRQLEALKTVYSWRDGMARREDESEGYVLPNHMLFQIAELLPKEPQGVLACCNPIPPLLRQNLAEVHALVLAARDMPLTQEPAAPPATTRSQSSAGIIGHGLRKAGCPLLTDPLLCRHDLSRDVAIPIPGVMSSKSSLIDQGLSGKVAPVKATVESALCISLDSRHQTQPTCQGKAAEIMASFAHPFEMFMPKHLLPKKPQNTKVWKLKPNTKQVKVKTDKQEIRENVKARIDKAEEEVGVLSFNQLKHQSKEQQQQSDEKSTVLSDKKKKTKKTGSELKMFADKTDSPPEGNSNQKRKKGKLTVEGVEAQGFTAHVYSTSDMTSFSEPKAKKQKGKKDEYDAAAVHFNPVIKGASKPRINPVSGQKTMTFKKKRKPEAS